ncbi:type II toxin-antitoxin system YafQ family toxin [Helicobacter pylori]|nr:type II toxin-antitoxin system YafQ family toxin [Helicobacter pylori]
MQRPPAQRRFIKDFRECHLKPDLLLVYQIKKPKNTLFLVRLGSHSELF